ncbi:uncharacterized protein LOC117590271 [Drosophila guanche]|uniref:Uncharacterized protein n=1 Tax=Drosophila guanche TaxID=7266 RepID=A0A3B0K771_DROGU|nr:uncharacterized protein LOC117590271 [Drosophila guanche]SPP88522.1 Hypothetical predicted protein [Drosophila guanche]
MKHQVSVLVLLGCCLLAASAGQERPKSTAQLLKAARRSSYFNEPALAKFRSNDADIAVALDQKADQDKLMLGGAAAQGSSSSTATKDASSGRLFLKKFLMFKNMFSSNNQPVIPIIITGAGTGTGTGTATASPTVTVTSTGTIPSATGTITTSPTTTGTTTGRRQSDALNYGADVEEDDAAEADEPQEQAYPGAMAANAELLDEQALEAALAAGAQEYEVVTDAEVQGTGATESKATQNNMINLRRKGARRGQQISVRIPPRYRRYFKNGQKVMLNTNRRPNKRRVVRKRVQNKKQQNRRRVNGGNKKNNRKNRNKNKGNKRTRITAV